MKYRKKQKVIEIYKCKIIPEGGREAAETMMCLLTGLESGLNNIRQTRVAFKDLPSEDTGSIR